MLCGPLKSSLTRMLITWWALRAEKQGYCASRILTAPPHTKKKEGGAKAAMAKPPAGLLCPPEIHTDSKIHTAVAA